MSTSNSWPGLRRVGHTGITGDRRQGSSRGAGYEKCTSRSNDATRLGYVEVLADEQKETNRWIPGRASGLVSLSGDTCRRILQTKRPLLRSGRLAKSLSRLEISSPSHQALHAADQTGRPNVSSKTILANGLT